MTGDSQDVDDGHDFEPGEAGPEIVVENLEHKDFVKYAGASGDFNPIHYSEPFANEAGYPSVFGQGMFTAGVASNVAVAWFGLENVVRFRVRFQDQVWPGDNLRADGKVTDVEFTEDGEQVHADIFVRNQEGETVLSGSVVAELGEGRTEKGPSK